MINEQGYELVQSDVSSGDTVICKLTIFNFVDHVLDLLFCWIVSHRPHQIWELVYRYLLVIKFSSFSRVFLLCSDNTIVKEVIHVLKCLAFSSALD